MNDASIIIPAYNEETGIAAILDKLTLMGDQYEVIVVDDGSEDKTAGVVKNYLNIKLIRHDHNLGYGAALKTGIKAATNDTIAIIDADGTYPDGQIPDLIKVMKEGDYAMVVGARTGKNVKIPLIRKPAKWFINKLANYLVGTRIPDLNSGLRVMKKSALDSFIHILPDGFSFTTTITLAMLTNGYAVKYVPINYFRREGKSKIRPVRDTLNFIQLIIRTVLYFNPLKIFVPLSICLVFIAFIVLIVSQLYLGRAMDVTFGVILMTAVMVLAIGMLADLIDKRLQ
ncbi:MAG TPA: glycosyltransferase family 2 protein [Nitrospirae bacterium]|nr:undecaprenyl-phosphate 4-deoxy-4-formamido-L-arabinose transferase [bacterium BMS3Abin10]GBE38309.1 undecaprenyl-phosphate 4-deoxy-4-formamido-L-arabinose transferase [bacterium BMS3Bbin08]HDH49877.1 glycosyltransferase family 2 protein [Nitrospirota bacterium]HDK16668.1 glycosyltransferase family 2 protein [Nitrospirota bacterium]HDK81991.1 glycosyltransferase family 2 protein [Nitrospirota bacterium]